MMQEKPPKIKTAISKKTVIKIFKVRLEALQQPQHHELSLSLNTKASWHDHVGCAHADADVEQINHEHAGKKKTLFF